MIIAIINQLMEDARKITIKRQQVPIIDESKNTEERRR